MKFLLILCLVATLATFAVGSSVSWGRRNATDYLLYREDVVRNPIRNNIVRVNVVYPRSGYNNKIITAVYVYDKFTNSSGAIPSLYSGGPRYNHATVNLSSQMSYGIRSTVEIYGK